MFSRTGAPARATAAGIAAILLWSSLVGLIRLVTEDLGVAGGAAMIYTACALLMLVTTGRPRVSRLPKTYLWAGMLLFTAYELCFAASIGLATTGRQAIEVSIVNYLWPSLTVLFAILFTGQRAGWLVVPGLAMSIAGVAIVLGDESGLHLGSIIENVQSNPASYLLALTGALLWAGYCTVTKLYARGANGVTLFFLCTAACFWVLYAVQGAPPMRIGGGTLAVIALAAGAAGFGYYLWNFGISHGNMALIAALSYFTPVFSAGIAAVLLTTSLNHTFWIGTAVVSIGAVLCWIATRDGDREEDSEPAAVAA